MSVAEPLPSHRPEGSGTRAFQAFGLEILVPADVPGLPAPAVGSAGSAGRTTRLEPTTAAALEQRWSSAVPETVLERRFPDGRLVMSVDFDPAAGYRVYAPYNGRHLVSVDGSRIVSALPRTAPWRWQRLLFAQVLPLAATLMGLELLHASAVEVGGHVLGFVARAGTGKTSVAAHIVADGATLMTDDVLALEVLDGSLVAHPGVATLNIDRTELDQVPRDGHERLGRPLGGREKVALSVPVVDGTRPLAALYFLRRPGGDALEIEALESDPVRVLASSFNTYVRSPARVQNQLEVVDRLVSSVAMYSVGIPLTARASDVAHAVVAHAEGGG